MTALIVILQAEYTYKQELIKKIDRVISELKMLLEIKSTAERNNLLGSSHKRKAFLSKDINEKINSYKN